MAFGDSVWPSNYGNPTSVDAAFPSYTNVLKNGSKATWQGVIAAAAVTADMHWVEVEVIKTCASATDTSAVLDIGVDAAGGTSYTAVISDLLVGHADDENANNGTGGSIFYAVPLKITSGSSIAIRGQTGRGADQSCNVGVQLRGGATGTPFNGTTCYTLGVSGTGGTSVTPGSDAFGSWTNVGSATAADIQAVTLGIQPPTGTTVNRNEYIFELGWSSTVKTGRWKCHFSSSESTSYLTLPHYVLVPSGTQLQVRCRASSGNTIDNPRVAVYGVSAS